MLTPEQIADGWKPHDGKSTPSGKVQPMFLEAGIGRCAMPADMWSGRWEWWGARTKKPYDVIAYREEPSDAA